MKLVTARCNKPDHFIAFYEKLFLDFAPKRILEIGVQTGRSLSMWKNAFPTAEVIGIDIEEPSEPLARGVQFIKGSQTDTKLLEALGNFDLIVDDGGHMNSHQQISFEALMPQLNSRGVYVIEDTETSYKSKYTDTKLNTVDYFKEKVGAREEQGKMLFATEGIASITFIEDLLAIEKL